MPKEKLSKIAHLKRSAELSTCRYERCPVGDAAGVGRFPLIGFLQGSKASVRRISESPALADALKAALQATLGNVEETGARATV
jgi:hypothetical protein